MKQNDILLDLLMHYLYLVLKLAFICAREFKLQQGNMEYIVFCLLGVCESSFDILKFSQAWRFFPVRWKSDIVLKMHIICATVRMRLHKRARLNKFLF